MRERRRNFGRVTGLAALCVTIACAEEPDAPPAAPPAATTRLLDDLEAVQVRSAWDPRRPWDALTEGIAPALAVDFETPPADMHAYVLPRPFMKEPPPGAAIPAPAPPTLKDGMLRFPAASGGALWWLPVQPDTPYGVDVQVRRHAAAAVDAKGTGSTVLLELTAEPDLDAHDGDVWAALAAVPRAASHSLEATTDGERQRRSVVFRSTVFTRALVVFLVAGDPGWWLDADADPAFAVEFDDLAVHELPLRRYLAVQHLSVQDDVGSLLSLPGDDAPPAAWFTRKVKLVGDVRRALLAPPTTRIECPLQLPDGRFRVSLSYGVVEERTRLPGPVRVRAHLEADDGGAWATLDRTLQPDTTEDLGWHEFVCEGQAKGQTARLVLETEATDPGDTAPVAVFGEPRLTRLDRDAPPPPNVILISVDTLRSDHLGCYGYRRTDGLPTSPNLDRMAAAGLLFESARSVAPYTLPSHATMMTGLYPRVHGVQQVGARLTERVHPLLAQELADAGYATAAFTGGGFLSHEHGFDHGFDRYSILDPMMSRRDPLRNDFPFLADRARNDVLYQRTGMQAVEQWIEAQEGAPFFLFLHTFLVHNYHAEAARERRFVRADETGFLTSDRSLHPLDKQFAAAGRGPPPALLATLRDLYDATIAEFDEHLGRLETLLRQRGLWDHTVILLTSDHGEEFGEHQGLLHGRTLYEEVLRVPLLVWGPGIEAARIPQPVDLTDVAPTLLAAAGLAPWPSADGRDLRARVAHADFLTTLWAEVDAPNLSRRTACLAGSDKLLHNPAAHREEPGFESRRPPEFEVYDVSIDPTETRNLWEGAPGQPAVGEWRSLQRLHDQVGQRLSERHTVLVPDPALLLNSPSASQAQQLRALGYVVSDH